MRNIVLPLVVNSVCISESRYTIKLIKYHDLWSSSLSGYRYRASTAGVRLTETQPVHTLQQGDLFAAQCVSLTRYGACDLFPGLACSWILLASVAIQLPRALWFIILCSIISSPSLFASSPFSVLSAYSVFVTCFSRFVGILSLFTRCDFWIFRLMLSVSICRNVQLVWRVVNFVSV